MRWPLPTVTLYDQALSGRAERRVGRHRPISLCRSSGRPYLTRWPPVNLGSSVTSHTANSFEQTYAGAIGGVCYWTRHWCSFTCHPSASLGARPLPSRWQRALQTETLNMRRKLRGRDLGAGTRRRPARGRRRPPQQPTPARPLAGPSPNRSALQETSKSCRSTLLQLPFLRPRRPPRLSMREGSNF